MSNHPTKIIFNNEAKQKILKAVNRVYDAVRMSFGPQGANALIYGLYGRPMRLTNDGVTIADVIVPKDEFEYLVNAAFVDAAKKTNQKVGDGTTLTTIIGGKLINDIFSQINDDVFASAIESKSNGPITIKKKLLETMQIVVEKLKQLSKPIETEEDLEKIAIVSIENKEIGKVVANMAWKVGQGGFIDVVEGHKGEIETELTEGARFPAKPCGKIFINRRERFEMVAEDCPILLTNFNINKAIFGNFFTTYKVKTKIVIIANDFTEQALIAMANLNIQNKEMIFYPVKVPSLRTEQYEDIAVYCGAKFFNKDAGDRPDFLQEQDLGFLTKFIVKDSEAREDAVAIGGKGLQKREIRIGKGKEVVDESYVEQRIKILQSQVEETKEESHKNLLRRRIAGLASATGVIRVSSLSEAETYYMKKKIEDGVYACKAALEEGYVQGGGLALKQIAETLPDDDLLKPALFQPHKQLQENAGGIDIGDDIIDPTKAIRLALEHAVSVVANLATVNVIIPEERDKNPAEGYERIADAINLFSAYQAKHLGLIKQGEFEVERDRLAHEDDIIRSHID